MSRKKQQAAQAPVHQQVRATNVLRHRDIDKCKTTAALDQLCLSCGISSNPTIEKTKRDLNTYKSLDWGGKRKKVTVEYPQGPSAIFDDVEHTPEAIFDLLFTNDMWNLLITETIQYKPKMVR